MSSNQVLNDKKVQEIQSPAQEDLLIEKAMQILDRRLFTRGPKLESPPEVGRFLKLKLAGMEREVFCVIFLDIKHQVLAFETMFQGDLGHTSVYPRQVLKRAIAHNASAVIVAHNHPSGCLTPSRADRALTQRLHEALALIDVVLLDHIIVGAGDPLSMTQHGLM
ncbi:RadC family protein [Pseudomonas sp. FEN]|uniref:RadC family protein n=1 Tax=Pseudomonas sp. FEN TaxID=2767468 RepID=UPI0017484C36|nr:DNA repair protein RadC [Pseudomonas sp. FEN]